MSERHAIGHLPASMLEGHDSAFTEHPDMTSSVASESGDLELGQHLASFTLGGLKNWTLAGRGRKLSTGWGTTATQNERGGTAGMDQGNDWLNRIARNRLHNGADATGRILSDGYDLKALEGA